MNIRIFSTAAIATAALGFAACGGGDDTTSADTQTFAATDVTQCFEGAGQKVRKVEVSFAKIPPDLGVSSQAGGANVWITNDTQAVVDQAEELAKLDEAEALIPIEDRVVQIGNVIAVVDSDASPDYRATIEDCIPPTG